MLGILGNKVGMTQLFAEDGTANPVTVIKVGPCTITQIKSIATHGYDAIQIGYQQTPEKKLTKPELGHLKKANVTPLKYLKEYRVSNIEEFELGQIIAGTYGGQVLSDLGAEVIKVETPNGDLGRIPSVAPINGESGLFLTFNRNKKSIVIDLKTDQGLELFYELVKKADVVIDNFRPGVLKRMKINYEVLSEINKRIIPRVIL